MVDIHPGIPLEKYMELHLTLEKLWWYDSLTETEAKQLREKGIECEFADPETLVLMFTPENPPDDLHRLLDALGTNNAASCPHPSLPMAKGRRVCSVREALFSPHETVPVQKALGRICGAPTVACPPAIPIAVSGEEITQEALELFMHYHVESVDVISI